MTDRAVLLKMRGPADAETTSPGLRYTTTGRPAAWGRRIAWALARVVVLAALAGIGLHQYFSRSSDPERLTLLAIEIAGTPVSRGLVWLAAVVMLAAIVAATARLGAIAGYLAALLLSACVLAGSLRAGEAQILLVAPMLVVLAANLLPDAAWRRMLPSSWLRDRVMTLGIGVAELLQTRRYLEWLVGRELPARRVVLRSLPGIAIAAAMLVLAIKSAPIVSLEQALRMPDHARTIQRGNFNQIALAHDARHLFATGHGVPRLLRLDVGGGAGGHVAAAVDTGGAQGFALDEAARELYVYHMAERRLLVLDAETLAPRRSFPLPQVSPGDPWIAVHPATNTIVIVSEADESQGTPFVAIDRMTGELRDRRDLDAGNILLPPGDHRLFMSFFRRRGELMTYDLRSGEIIARVEAPRRVDRMAFVPNEDELLLAVPAESRILRYDATSLALKGELPSIFGIRSLAIDTTRGLLFGASLVSGEIIVSDLATGGAIGRFYIAPWLRTIELDTRQAVAFVSSAHGLHEVRYGHLR
jgi:hypothetical protein